MLNFIKNLCKRIRLIVERGWCHDNSTHVETDWWTSDGMFRDGSSMAIFRFYFNVHTRKRMIVLWKHNYPFYHHPYRHPYVVERLIPWEKGLNFDNFPKPEIKLDQILIEIEEEKIKAKEKENNRLELERLERLGIKQKL